MKKNILMHFIPIKVSVIDLVKKGEKLKKKDSTNSKTIFMDPNSLTNYLLLTIQDAVQSASSS